jgi:hypothetical protein
MTDRPIDASRRRAVQAMLGGLAAVPLMQLVGLAAAQAADLPQLAEDDPTAKALKYVHDATKAARADKGGVAADKQFCSNCMFIQAPSGAWRPCQLFAGKAVNENGWCMSWAPKPA